MGKQGKRKGGEGPALEDIAISVTTQKNTVFQRGIDFASNANCDGGRCI
jgi:hypothetical protein